MLLLPALRARAEVFVNDAAPAPVNAMLIEGRLQMGVDYETLTSMNEGGLGVRLALLDEVLSRTRASAWVSATYGGSICADGTVSPSEDPLLGCYSMSVVAAGLSVRQTLIAREHGALAVEAGANIHNVPASAVLTGFHEHLLLQSSAPFAHVMPFLQLGGALNEFPFLSEVDRIAIGRIGVEFAAGAFRPSFDLTVLHIWYPFNAREETTGEVTFALGYAIE